MTVPADPAAQLTRFAMDAQPSDNALAMMRLSLFDWAACAMAGRGEPVAQIVRDGALHEGGIAEASVAGSQTKLPARAAARVNGTISHALDYVDTHFGHIGHPSVAVIPAALAVGEAVQASGAAVLNAALIGAEASIRLGLWLGRSHYQHGFHMTSTAGAFGAALAAARLIGCDAGQMAQALGVVSTQAAGLKSQFGSMGKPYNAGLAAGAGVEAALLAARGFQSNPEALTGPQGFAETHAAEEGATAFDGLGRDWLMLGVTHKFHACCHGLHAALECVRELGEIDPADIAQIDVAAHPRWLSVCNQPAPDTGLGAKFSFTTVLAMAFLGYDTTRMDSFSDATCANELVQALRAQVGVAGDAELSETEAELRVTLTDGTTHTATHDLNTPLPFSAREKKLLSKGESLLGPISAPILSKAVFGSDWPDLPAITLLLRQG